MKAARYLNWRINRQVNKEDTALINSVQAGMTSSSYDVGPLGSTEVCLRSFARKYRALMPVVRNRQAAGAGLEPALGLAHAACRRGNSRSALSRVTARRSASLMPRSSSALTVSDTWMNG